MPPGLGRVLLLEPTWPWQSSVLLGNGAKTRPGPWRSTAARASRQRAVVALFGAGQHSSGLPARVHLTITGDAEGKVGTLGIDSLHVDVAAVAVSETG